MVGEPAGTVVSDGSARTIEERRRADLDRANSNRSMAAGLGGTSVAILTFALFFLYDGSLSGRFDPLLFRITLGTIVASLFFFAYAAADYYRLMSALDRGDPHADALVRWADVYFLVGFLLMTVAPTLILFTARILDVGVFALVLWIGVLVIAVHGWNEWD